MTSILALRRLYFRAFDVVVGFSRFPALLACFKLMRLVLQSLPLFLLGRHVIGPRLGSRRGSNTTSANQESKDQRVQFHTFSIIGCLLRMIYTSLESLLQLTAGSLWPPAAKASRPARLPGAAGRLHRRSRSPRPGRPNGRRCRFPAVIRTAVRKWPSGRTARGCGSRAKSYAGHPARSWRRSDRKEPPRPPWKPRDSTRCWPEIRTPRTENTRRSYGWCHKLLPPGFRDRTAPRNSCRCGEGRHAETPP